MAASVVQGTVANCIAYDSEHNRIEMDTRATSCSGSLSQSTLYLNDPISGAMEEKVTVPGASSPTWRDYISSPDGMVAVRSMGTGAPPAWGSATWNQFTWTAQSSSTVSMLYIVSDHLGSVSVAMDGTGAVSERDSYDAWGRRRNADGSDAAACTAIASASTRGFTDQEHMDPVCAENFNARLYDPTIARFLSADSMVPDRFNTQSFNRFSYVNNGPLSATDPSGHGDTDDKTKCIENCPIPPSLPLCLLGECVGSHLGSYDEFDDVQDGSWLSLLSGHLSGGVGEPLGGASGQIDFGTGYWVYTQIGVQDPLGGSITWGDQGSAWVSINSFTNVFNNYGNYQADTNWSGYSKVSEVLGESLEGQWLLANGAIAFSRNTLPVAGYDLLETGFHTAGVLGVFGQEIFDAAGEIRAGAPFGSTAIGAGANTIAIGGTTIGATSLLAEFGVGETIFPAGGGFIATGGGLLAGLSVESMLGSPRATGQYLTSPGSSLLVPIPGSFGP